MLDKIPNIISYMPLCESSGQTTQYWGESGHNSYSRGRTHWESQERRSKTSILHQHAVKDHGGASHKLTPKNFRMEVLGGHPSCISRQIHEGTSISHQLSLRDREARMGLGQPRKILNSWTEFFQPGLIAPRVTKLLYWYFHSSHFLCMCRWPKFKLGRKF